MRRSWSLLALAAVAGCAVVPAGVAYNPNPQPPPVRAEVIPQPPVSDQVLIWQPGHWDWDSVSYTWRSGRYVTRAGHGTEWQDGYWSDAPAPWHWVPAHWM